VQDAVNKTFELNLSNHCINNRIGTIVFGWNKGQKMVELGKINNQKFIANSYITTEG